MLADAAPEVCRNDVFGMNCVGVERRTIMKDGDESRVVRAREMQRVEAD